MVDRSVGLWVVTLLILGVFAAAAVITPQVIQPNGEPGGNGTDGPITRTGMDYRQPVLRERPGEMEEDLETALNISAQPDREVLQEGGKWVWTFSVVGSEMSFDDATIRYSDDGYVGWMSSPGSGMLTGFGPRFEQGPGAAMTPAELEFNITIYKPGSFTLRIWIMDQEAIGEGGLPSPSSSLARSTELIVPLTVEEPPPPKVTVEQSLVGPSGEQPLRQYIDLEVSDRADRGDTEWDGTVVDYISLEREGITIADVTGRASTGLIGRTAIMWEQQEDRLVGQLRSTEPYGGLIDRTEWTIDVELRFSTGGNYTVTVWAADGDTGEVISERTSIDLVVESEEEEEAEETGDPNGTTNESESSLIPSLQWPFSSAPAVASSAVAAARD